MFGFKIKLLKKNLLAGKHYANRGNTVCHKRFFSELLHVQTHKCTINLELFVLLGQSRPTAGKAKIGIIGPGFSSVRYILVHIEYAEYAEYLPIVFLVQLELAIDHLEKPWKPTKNHEKP